MILTASDLPDVIAHRGAKAYAPENTIAAFKKAHTLGATWIEFDITLTACGELIVMHDRRLNRTTNGRGKVYRSTYTDIANLDAGSWFAPEFRGETVPILTEVLAFLQQTGMHANIELKPCPGTEQAISQATLDCLNQHWQQGQYHILLSTDSIACLSALRALGTDIPLALVSDKWQKDWQHYVQKYELFSLHFYHKKLTAKRIQQTKQYYPQLPVLAYTVNDQSRADNLYKLGIRSVFSDYPDLLADEC